MSLPHNIEAEQGLLAAIIADPRQSRPKLPADAKEYFYDLRNREIFNDFALDQQPIEAKLVLMAPERRAYVAGLHARAVSPELVGYFLDILRPLYARRRQIEAADKIRRSALAGEDIADGQRILAEIAKHAPTDFEERRFNPDLNPQPVRPVFTMAGAHICTPGNLATITAHAKAGKSGLINALLAAPMATAGVDTLSVISSNEFGLAVVHIDTEQSREDHWHQVSRAIRRAGRETLPPWLLSYCLTGFDARKARAAVWGIVKQAADQFGGVHSIHIDGAADLVCDVNDAAECNEFVGALHALAIDHDCPITVVIHFNPGTEKTRGHLGSQLERKAETNLRIDKDAEVSEVWSDKQRRAPILKGQGPRYAWSVEASMHVTVQVGPSAKETAKREDAICLRDDVFNGRASMRYSELEIGVKTTTGKSEETAKRILRTWVKFGIVEKSVAGLWIPKA